MSKLKEYKDKYEHYYHDAQGRMQGEYKSWLADGTLYKHCLRKNGLCHGESKWWWSDDGTLAGHTFYQTDVNITAEIEELVEDFENITDEEKVIIKLKFGIECLS